MSENEKKFNELLYRYKELQPESSHDMLAKGRWFEKLCLYFLRHEPLYKDRFERVWLWSDWPGRNGRPDTGIDIVAKLRDSETFCAVQCKFYEPDHSISKDDIDSFITASDKKGFAERIIIATTTKWSKHAEHAIEDLQVPCQRVTLDMLAQSSIDWSKFDESDLDRVSYLPPKTLRPDQRDAIAAVIEKFKAHDKGKLIMACGTGKTFVSLNIAGQLAGAGKKILVLVPSIALMNQTIIAWSADRQRDMNMIFFAVCSDDTVGANDEDDIKITDLVYPASTSSEKLLAAWSVIPDERKRNSMTVIFSTYQSLQVINEIQSAGFPDFDLIICDEAHRTAGAVAVRGEGLGVRGDKGESNFMKVHHNSFVRAAKRLYMTATPKVYTDSVVKTAKEKDAVLYSMDDEEIFGPVFYELSFSEAVRLGLLSDYRVIVLGVDEDFISETLGSYLKDASIDLDDASKMVGCWKGLSKNFLLDDFDSLNGDTAPMKRALAFTSTIANSKDFQATFAGTIRAFRANDRQDGVKCDVQHVDGTMNAGARQRILSWLSEDGGDGVCRLVSNARCLSEGVDVPALDAIMFLNPKRSRVDIVQAVGRVMRKTQDKKFGYVILPVVIPPGMTPEQALDNNKSYNVIWDVLQALRSIDGEFYVEVNNIKFGCKSGKIIASRVGKHSAHGDDDRTITIPTRLTDWSRAVYVRLVEKCGDREYTAKWAAEMKHVADRHRERVQEIVDGGGDAVNEIFGQYLKGLRDNINENIKPDEAVDMLSQHYITKPIFDACFNDFSKDDPVSKTLEEALRLLVSVGLGRETQPLEPFYERQRRQVAKIPNDEGKQRFIREIYESFFKVALPRTAQRLGIVYTPEEIVDFILNSADWALKHELGIPGGMSSHDVAILDPFTGTGSFIVRLLQLGLISPDELAYKYEHEIFANEILLLPYYIASVNIAMTYGSVAHAHELFPGVVFTDTFNNKTGHGQTYIFTDNSKKAIAERNAPIRVIIGNPPYSVGQSSANDNNKNTEYNDLDDKIRLTYAAESSAKLKRNLYDSYIRAIRWATDKLEGCERGIVCYVTNGSFIDSNSADGLRKCLCEDFQSIYVFNLRGDATLQGEPRRKEGGNVFGDGTRLPVAITLFVRKPHAPGSKCRVLYRDIGDYLSRDEKLAEVKRSVSFGRMISDMEEITPNSYGDWINQRHDICKTFLGLGNKDRPGEFAIFGERYSSGVVTARDAWCYNFSREALKRNMAAMIDVYNAERERWHARKKSDTDIEGFVTMDPQKISWDRQLLGLLKGNRRLTFSESRIVSSLYRPFTKSNLYFDSDVNEMTLRMPSIFPARGAKNLVIGISGVGSKKGFSVLMTDCVPDIQLIFNGQCFPLYWYERAEEKPATSQMSIFDEPQPLTTPGYVRRDAMSDEALTRFRTHYRDPAISKEDIFYYIYAVLNSPEYRERFAIDVFRDLARVPFAKNFWIFSEAGRRLGNLHVNYENVGVSEELGVRGEELDSRVEKMRLIKLGGEKVISYNSGITITGIPASAWDYVVNGKSALEWIIERYQNTTDKDSGLQNDCNAWGTERGDPKYILNLIGRVVTVSVETVKILKGLPELGIKENPLAGA